MIPYRPVPLPRCPICQRPGDWIHIERCAAKRRARRLGLLMLAVVACAGESAADLNTASPEAPAVVGCAARTSGVLLGDSIVAALWTNAKGILLTPGQAVTSLAVSGHRIDQQLAAWEAHPELWSADWVIVQVGVNNVNQHYTLAQMESDFTALVDDVALRDPAAQVIVGVILPCRSRFASTPGAWEEIEAFNGWLSSTYAARWDAYDALDDGTGSLAPALDSGDKIHPNVAGNALDADAFHRWAVESYPLEVCAP